MARLVIFTDLDGTLLDHHTYSWEAAQAALQQLQARQIPIVLCTSKTKAEVRVWVRRLKLNDPFVVENGGAIYVPRNYFPFPLPTARRQAGYQVLELGVRYQKLTRALYEAAHTSGVRVRGFSRMTDQEVAERCELDVVEARRARRREFDETFVLEQASPTEEADFLAELRQRGLRCRRGTRFLHLMGDTDKGVAVTRLMELYRRAYGEIRTVGVGDSPNDVDFLQIVDVPVLVARPDGRYDAEVEEKIPRARFAPGAGPVGWNQAILEILSQEKLPETK